MNKKTITLRWPPTKVHVAWGFLISLLMVVNLYLIPTGLVQEGDSGWNRLSCILIFLEVIAATMWSIFTIIDADRW